MDASSGSPWSTPETVAGFAQSPPNPVLMRFAREELARAAGDRASRARALDVGCGAGRNAVPLARLGWEVVGLDLSEPMLRAAARRAADEPVADSADSAEVDEATGAVEARGRAGWALARMEALPVADRSVDLVVAHGIWNLARSAAEFRAAVAEAARVAKPGAGLFVFTFSRHTFGPEAAPVPGEAFVFTEFSGQPQCFLTEGQLVAELDAAGFAPDPAVPLTEYNRAAGGLRAAGSPPVLYEAAFRRRA